ARQKKHAYCNEGVSRQRLGLRNFHKVEPIHCLSVHPSSISQNCVVAEVGATGRKMQTADDFDRLDPLIITLKNTLQCGNSRLVGAGRIADVELTVNSYDVASVYGRIVVD